MRWFFTVVCLMFFAFAPARADVPCPASGFVQSAVDAFSAASRKGTPQAFSSAAARYADLRSISLFALGKYRGDLSPARESEYVTRTRNYMGNFMAQYANRFSGNNVTIISCTPMANGLQVRARYDGGGSLAMRLRGGNGHYQIEDVSISSIWLAQTMRNKFSSVISDNNGDTAALISWLGQ